MMQNWRKHEEKLQALKSYFERESPFGAEVEVESHLPGEEGFELEKEIPYIKLMYYYDENHCKVRRIELFDYYLEQNLEELKKLITDMVEEFISESEHTEFGGG